MNKGKHKTPNPISAVLEMVLSNAINDLILGILNISSVFSKSTTHWILLIVEPSFNAINLFLNNNFTFDRDKISIDIKCSIEHIFLGRDNFYVHTLNSVKRDTLRFSISLHSEISVLDEHKPV